MSAAHHQQANSKQGGKISGTNAGEEDSKRSLQRKAAHTEASQSKKKEAQGSKKGK
jgi:hypothetical protein